MWIPYPGVASQRHEGIGLRRDRPGWDIQRSGCLVDVSERRQDLEALNSLFTESLRIEDSSGFDSACVGQERLHLSGDATVEVGSAHLRFSIEQLQFFR